MDEKLQTTISGMEKMTISSQDLSDKNWEILKQFRKLSEKTGKYLYYVLIKCKKCGHIKLYSKKNIGNSNIECPHCISLKYIGNTYGIYKVLNLEREVINNGRLKRYYTVQCINCKKTYVKELNTTQWKKYSKCRYCNIDLNNPVDSILYSNYKYNAKIRHLDFELTFNQFHTLIHSNCTYCGTSPHERKITKGSVKIIKANGIDRIDSNKGYILKNCVPCCPICNYMKSNSTVQDFKNHITRIYNYLNLGSTTIENTLNSGSE